ncbi:DUF3566 domain-containing protein [Kutzneria kofuensis]|uniref:DUF3566 domain-containing protein n=1 Tax=Kutzneria kofuensis TaxID=103725 RepID=A0A7W9KHD6_9PSEU|nr:DUF3566 domain-containing protein [Kutzneria kofuensis]MBB5892637.1 hypothetical protein [Kutzneria kofuensis]
MTTPENPEQPDAKTEQDGEVEKKSVATEEAPAKPEQPEEAADAAEPATNGATASHEQETAKFSAGEAAAAEPAASSAPPPWQRVTADNAAAAAAANAGTIASTAYDNEPVDTSSQATTNFRPVTPPEPAASPLDSPTVSTRTSVNLGGPTPTPPRGTAAPTALRRPGRGPRRASLQIKRVDPWSVLKLALVLGFAMFLVWMVAVGVLYSVLGGMNVWTKLNGTYNDLVQGGDNSGGDLISAGRVFGIAAVVGLVNVILFTAMATVSAFIYNVSADLAGGVEVTLSERE